MKRIIQIFSLCIIMASCTSKDVKVSNNVLLGDNVQINYIVNFDNSTQPSEWLLGLDKSKLFEPAFKQVLSNKVDVYSPNYTYFVNEKFSVGEIKNLLESGDTVKYDELKEILFREQWDVPTDLKSFTKIVEYWCPVKVWHPVDKPAETYKRKIFVAKPISNEKGNIFAESIFTEFDLSNVNFYPSWTGFDPDKFINTVFDKIQENKQIAYDPIYIVDKSLVPLSPEKLKEFIGQSLTTDQLRRSVESLIFEENWYFDAESMNIYKEVISIGFVRKYWENSEQKSKILLFIKF